ncbi:MAG: DUF2357 domain-containing protein [Chloroflexota bacterium]
MKPSQQPAEIAFTDRRGAIIARMAILPRLSGGLALLDPRTAAERAEAPVQLFESQSYEYRFTVVPPAEWRLRETQIVQPGSLDAGGGRIEPGLHTGVLPLELLRPDGTVGARADLEVRSAKIDYYQQYRTMLSDIADRALGLVTDIRAPAYTRLESARDGGSLTIHQRFALVRSVMETEEFTDAIERIAAMPDRRWAPIEESADVRRGMRPSRGGIVAVARDPRRRALPDVHPVAGALRSRGAAWPTVPAHLPGHRSVDTFDTPANRFVKYALSDMRAFLEQTAARLDPRQPEDLRIFGSVNHLASRLEKVLQRPMFAGVGGAGSLALGSPVIQRKAGYREILRAWVRFRMSAQLTWSGGAEVFEAGKRDIAQLYEYWLFFLLLDVFNAVVEPSPARHQGLIEFTDGGFDLRLAAGSAFTVRGRVAAAALPLTGRFSYNRVFSGKQPNGSPSYPLAGSWTRTMRPDFTFSFWPADMDETAAEIEDRLVHIHFDAKYRVESIAGLFGMDGPDELDDDPAPSRPVVAAKRSDLLKMHAYRDAIRRSQGAYVLYPGTDGDSTQWREYHELLPGLGAFAVRPRDSARSFDAITRFVTDAIACFSSSLGLPDFDRRWAAIPPQPLR